MTIGYGHMGPNVFANQVITQSEADTFAKDEVETILGVLKTKLPAIQITDAEIAAIINNWPVA